MPGRASKLSTRSSSPSPSEGDFQKPTEKKTCQFFNKGNWWLVLKHPETSLDSWVEKHQWILVCLFQGFQFDKSSQIYFISQDDQGRNTHLPQTPWHLSRTFSPTPSRLTAGCLKIWRSLGGNPYHLSVFFWGWFLSNNLLQGYWKGQL